jgi:hypothetical protein
MRPRRKVCFARLIHAARPEGCAKSDVAFELPVRVHGSVWWHSAAPAGEAILMLSKLAYLTLCRSIQLLVLLARGDAAKLAIASVKSSRQAGSARAAEGSHEGHGG